MQRDLGRLSTEQFDLVIVGGGIYGSCAAWEAARRELSVALVEQGDFGGATSANSQKIIHGGFRYLQHFDVKRIRESVCERKRLMRLAPHLVRPTEVILPTYVRGLQSRPVMRFAAVLYDVLSWDRNTGVPDPEKRIPRTRVLCRAECLQRLPGLAPEGVTGAVAWYDGQIYNSERLTLAFVRAAADQGACVANYVRAAGLILTGGRVTGVRAEDRLTGAAFDVRGRIVINTSGPWVNRVAGLVDRSGLPRVPMVKTINVVIDRPLVTRYAFSVTHGPSQAQGFRREAARRLFVTPWRNRTIIGSSHSWADGDPDACRVTTDEIAALVNDFNHAYPGAGVRLEEVRFVHVGLMPHEDGDMTGDPARLARRYRILDHRRVGGPSGLITVVGVKYTTARDIAEKTVRIAMRALGRRPRRPRRLDARLPGGAIDAFDQFLSRLLAARPYGLAEDVLRQLACNYGSEYTRVLAYVERDASLKERLAPDCSVIRAEAIHAVREEMAQTLSDVVFRRTELGAAGYPGALAIRACADLVAAELGWTPQHTEEQLRDVDAVFDRLGLARTAALAGAAG